MGTFEQGLIPTMAPASVLTCLLFAALASSPASALTFTIQPNKEDCFFEEINKGEKVSMTFQVASGGFLDIDVKLLDPRDVKIFSKERETEGRHHFTTEHDGLYSLCFSNKMSTLTPKTVSFNFHVGIATTAHEVARKEHLTPLELTIVQLSEGLYNVQDEQKYMRVRERVHRNTTESTNARVLWWSFLEAAILVGMSLFQVSYLRRFFETKTVM